MYLCTKVYSVSFISALETNRISRLFLPNRAKEEEEEKETEACLKGKRRRKGKENDEPRECYVKLREYETAVGEM